MFNPFYTTVTLLPNLALWIGAAFAQITQLILSYTLNSFLDVFNDASVRSYLYFLNTWGGVMFIIGVGLALAEFAANHQEGNGVDVKGSVKNITIGLFASFGFITIPVLLYRFTIEVTTRLCEFTDSSMINQILESLAEFNAIEDASPDEILESIGSTLEPEIGSGLIGAIFCIVMCVFLLKILLGNLKRSGILIILLTICPIHLLSIPRGYTDGFYSWCKQVIGLCITFFVQNFLFALSMNYFANTGSLTLSNELITLGILMSSSEAPRILQQYGLESSVKSNASQAIFAASGITNIVRAFAG